MRKAMIVAATTATLTLSACSGNEEQEPAAQPSNTVSEAGGDNATDVAPAIPAPGDEVARTGNGDMTIPSAMQGRWGMVKADCTGPAAEAKGLITITKSGMEFYESVGKLKDVSQRTPRVIRATFAFTGEGMNWDREQKLGLERGGDALIRTEYGEGSLPDPLLYTKCAA
ncbi:hypothetical protein [Altericroceibacterium endophyticum]|uniref:Lipoprotein n=1 Tax=Altericroceibacterium endophyticum TaxID=1808508 RepID=A0A6I4T9D9_9SPHN|nr:hypothetical protein [Altericroceibacterium endophyticum]MXO67019.1 hypothetical protein [Altericroceibacterium endophyticum]